MTKGTGATGFLVSVVGFVLRYLLFMIVINQIGVDASSFRAVMTSAVFAIAISLKVCRACQRPVPSRPSLPGARSAR